MMLFALRRRIALAICPELRPRPWSPSDPNPLQLQRWLSEERAQIVNQRAHQPTVASLAVGIGVVGKALEASRWHQPPVLTWRDTARVCIPGYLIRRAVGVLEGPLYRAGPAICKRLEQRLEQLADRPALARHEVLLRSIALWLTQSPNSARQATPEETSDEQSSQPMRDLSRGSERGLPTSSETGS